MPTAATANSSSSGPSARPVDASSSTSSSPSPSVINAIPGPPSLSRTSSAASAKQRAATAASRTRGTTPANLDPSRPTVSARRHLRETVAARMTAAVTTDRLQQNRRKQQEQQIQTRAADAATKRATTVTRPPSSVASSSSRLNPPSLASSGPSLSRASSRQASSTPTTSGASRQPRDNTTAAKGNALRRTLAASSSSGNSSADEGAASDSSPNVWDRLSAPRQRGVTSLAAVAKTRGDSSTSSVASTVTSSALSSTSSTPKLAPPSPARRLAVPPKPTLHRQKSTPNLSTLRQTDRLNTAPASSTMSSSTAPSNTTTTAVRRTVPKARSPAPPAMSRSETVHPESLAPPAMKRTQSSRAAGTLSKRKSESDMRARIELRVPTIVEPVRSVQKTKAEVPKPERSASPSTRTAPRAPAAVSLSRPVRPSSPAYPVSKPRSTTPGASAGPRRRKVENHSEAPAAPTPNLSSLTEEDEYSGKGGAIADDETETVSSSGQSDDASPKTGGPTKLDRVTVGGALRSRDAKPRQELTTLGVLREEGEDDTEDEGSQPSSTGTPSSRPVKSLRWAPNLDMSASAPQGSSISTVASSITSSASTLMSREPSLDRPASQKEPSAVQQEQKVEVAVPSPEKAPAQPEQIAIQDVIMEEVSPASSTQPPALVESPDVPADKVITSQDLSSVAATLVSPPISPIPREPSVSVEVVPPTPTTPSKEDRPVVVTPVPSVSELSSFNTTLSGIIPPATPTTDPSSAFAQDDIMSEAGSDNAVFKQESSSPVPSLTEIPPGTKMRFKDLSLIRVLGSGSFGRVHLAVHRPTGVRVALKSLVKSELVRLKQVEHTVSEKEALEAVNSSSVSFTFGYDAASNEAFGRSGFPFIVKLQATFQDPLRVYFVMEHVGGGELFSLLRRREKLLDREARFYACEVALAIEHLHALHIVYRDLKPENVLLGADGHVKIVDFGFAKVLPAAGETYTLCGTPEYLAPEVIQPVSPTGGYTAAVDWWSFGVLVYEMIAGHPPFFVDGPAEGEDGAGTATEATDGEEDDDSPPVPLELYRKILDGRVGYPPWMSPVAKDLIRRLLVVDPSRRLGARLGDVESHPWFDGVDWDGVLTKRWELPPASPEELAAAALEAMESQEEPDEDDDLMNGKAETAIDAIYDPHAALFADF